MEFLDVLLLVVSVLLIALVMLQESKDDVRNTFSGEKSELFKNQKQRGPELLLTRMTFGMTVVFAVVTILALIL